MEEIGKFSEEELKALWRSIEQVRSTEFQLGLLKRGYQHLINELAGAKGITDKVRVDFKTGSIYNVEEENV